MSDFEPKNGRIPGRGLLIILILSGSTSGPESEIFSNSSKISCNSNSVGGFTRDVEEPATVEA